jgi:hypothetical protein
MKKKKLLKGRPAERQGGARVARRVPKLRRLLRMLGACREKYKLYRSMTLQEAWRAADWEDRSWLRSSLRWRTDIIPAGRLDYAWLDYASDKLPATLIKMWGGYERQRKVRA